jgi:hypothetical protein
VAACSADAWLVMSEPPGASNDRDRPGALA